LAARVAARIRRFANENLEAYGRLRIGIGCAPEGNRCFPRPPTMPTKRPKRSLAANVSALESRTEQNQETVEKAMVLNEIVRHRRIGHGSGEKLTHKPMLHSVRPTSLTRSA
jgi:hypothetical protein